MPSTNKDNELRLASTGLVGVQVHYRTASIPYRMQLQDLFVVPSSSAPPQDGGFLVTLTSPYLHGDDVPLDVLQRAPLQYALRDARCPTCAAVKKPPPSMAAELGGGGGPRMPAAMLRCEQCVLCPQCHACAPDVYLNKQRHASMVCPNCFWSSPSFTDTTLLTQWLGQCAQSVVRSSCGYSVCLPTLRQASAPLSVSLNARSAVNQAVSDGTLPFATLREEKIMQLDAALHDETERIVRCDHIAAANADMAASPQGRLLQASRTIEALATQTPVTPFVPVPDATGAGNIGDIQRRLGEALATSPLLVHTETSSSAAVGAGGRRGSVATRSGGGDGGGLGDGPATGAPSPAEELPPIQPVQKIPMLPRFDVGVSSLTAPVDTATTGAAKRPQPPSAIVSCVGACDAADGTSGSYFTSSHTNSALNSSLCAARFLPVVLLPANLSRWAKCDARSTTRKRLFLMLKGLNPDESRVTVRGLRVSAVSGCQGARLSVGTVSATLQDSGDTPLAAMPEDGIPIPNIRHQPLQAPTPSSAAPAADAAPSISSKRRATIAAPSAISPVVGSSLRYYIDNRIADCIFPNDEDTSVVPSDAAAATSAATSIPGFYVPEGGGALYVGVDVALTAQPPSDSVESVGPASNGRPSLCADDDEVPPVSIELELSVDVACAALHTALRTAYGTQTVAHHVSVVYRCVVAFRASNA